MKSENEKIEIFQYRTLKKGFYEVCAITDSDKIAIEGNVCSGMLLSLMEQTKNDKGKIVRVKGRDGWVFNTITKKIQLENKELKTANKKYKERIIKIRRLAK